MLQILSFLAGVCMMTLTTTQYLNAMKNRPTVAFLTSLVASCCIYVQINLAAFTPGLYIPYALGAACGSSLGIWLGHRR